MMYVFNIIRDRIRTLINYIECYVGRKLVNEYKHRYNIIKHEFAFPFLYIDTNSSNENIKLYRNNLVI